MKNPFNTLFGRMAVLSVSVLVIVHLGWTALMFHLRPHGQADGMARGIVLALGTLDARPGAGAERKPGAAIRLAALGTEPAAGPLPEHGPLRHLLRDLRQGLPAGSELRVDQAWPPHLWARLPGQSRWAVMALDMRPPPLPPFVFETTGMLVAAILLSLFVAWQMQRPIARVAGAARELGNSGSAALIPVTGPSELRYLAESFNDMMRRQAESRENQAVMLAGVAHDLKSPLTRLRLRADVLADTAERGGFVQDIDSITHIVNQFLEYANESPDPGPAIEADAFLRQQFSGALFQLRLDAGPRFVLPRTLVDRMVTNLVDNALEYGMPPIQIETRLDGEHWHIVIRDHGEGMPDAQVEVAMRPFVRLDTSRGGDGHCGLGLAIVSRLVERMGGKCLARNAPGGGFQVCLVLPAPQPPEHLVA